MTDVDTHYSYVHVLDVGGAHAILCIMCVYIAADIFAIYNLP